MKLKDAVCYDVQSSAFRLCYQPVCHVCCSSVIILCSTFGLQAVGCLSTTVGTATELWLGQISSRAEKATHGTTRPLTGHRKFAVNRHQTFPQRQTMSFLRLTPHFPLLFLPLSSGLSTAPSQRTDMSTQLQSAGTKIIPVPFVFVTNPYKCEKVSQMLQIKTVT
jgi:hypothetical protein